MIRSVSLLLACAWSSVAAQSVAPGVSTTTRDVAFRTHDGFPMRGRITLPTTAGLHPVVIYVQSAEGMTMEVRRRLSDTSTFRYMDLYAAKFPEMGVGFFRYDGRGIGVGDRPPRYETIDTAVFDTGTLDNKVSDLLAAIALVREQPGVDAKRIYLIAASEGTLLAAEAAARAPGMVAALVLYGVMADNMRETFRYIMSDGAFLQYRDFMDADNDGRITPDEYERAVQGPRGVRLRSTPFTAFDANKDSVFSVDDIRVGTKPYLDAIERRDYTVLSAWARSFAGVATPAGWFEDHFEHQTLWTFLSQLNVPVGLFQGELDPMTPAAAVHALQERAEAAGMKNLSFRYFARGDHSLGVGTYFVRGSIPEGHQAIFDFVRALVRRRE